MNSNQQSIESFNNQFIYKGWILTRKILKIKSKNYNFLIFFSLSLSLKSSRRINSG